MTEAPKLDWSSPSELALIGYYRFWLTKDHHLTLLVQRNGMNKDTVSEIANAYSFARSIKSGKCQELVDQILEVAADWPEKMPERAQKCIDVGEATGVYSGASKLMWLLKPNGWTPYDRYAAKTLRCGYGSSAEKMVTFYKRFEQFALKTKGLALLVKSVEQRLHTERVLDQFLVLHGMAQPDFAKPSGELESFVDALPKDFARSLVAASVATGGVISTGFAAVDLSAT